MVQEKRVVAGIDILLTGPDEQLIQAMAQSQEIDRLEAAAEELRHEGWDVEVQAITMGVMIGKRAA